MMRLHTRAGGPGRSSRRIRLLSCVLGALLGTPVCPAHFHFLIPDSPVGEPDVPTGLKFCFGHPFEHELQECHPPKELKAHPPRGEPRRLRVEDSGSSSAETSDSSAKKEHRFQYTPRERGDHIITAEARPDVEERDRQIVEDHVKVVLHVLSQNGWDRAVGQPLEVVPLTRPYGLRAGSSFHARVLLRGKPLEGAEVEIEKMNPSPPAQDLPEDEFITRAARTAPDGTLIATLDEKGWWAILVRTEDGKKTVNGREYSVELRSTLWVYVGEPLRGAGSH